MSHGDIQVQLPAGGLTDHFTDTDWQNMADRLTPMLGEPVTQQVIDVLRRHKSMA